MSSKVAYKAHLLELYSHMIEVYGDETIQRCSAYK